MATYLAEQAPSRLVAGMAAPGRLHVLLTGGSDLAHALHGLKAGTLSAADAADALDRATDCVSVQAAALLAAGARAVAVVLPREASLEAVIAPADAAGLAQAQALAASWAQLLRGKLAALPAASMQAGSELGSEGGQALLLLRRVENECPGAGEAVSSGGPWHATPPLANPQAPQPQMTHG